jgi:hypothetical protein
MEKMEKTIEVNGIRYCSVPELSTHNCYGCIADTALCAAVNGDNSCRGIIWIKEVAGTGVDAILTERGSRYGEFDKHAYITQELKAIMRDTDNWKNDKLTPDMKEALEMIQHKIGRILNGDPFYKDSWVDIEGYAKLVSKTLKD